jgi:hypothetical protein
MFKRKKNDNNDKGVIMSYVEFSEKNPVTIEDIENFSQQLSCKKARTELKRTILTQYCNISTGRQMYPEFKFQIDGRDVNGSLEHFISSVKDHGVRPQECSRKTCKGIPFLATNNQIEGECDEETRKKCSFYQHWLGKK